MTDAINTGYDHVWVTVTKVDLVGAGGKATNIYDGTSSGGQVVDLLSLHDSSGQKYMLLSGFVAPTGTYTGANVTVSDTASVVPTGGTSAVSANFSGATGGIAVLPLSFGGTQTASSLNNLVIDFNLANWTLSGTTLSAASGPYLQFAASPAGLSDPTRQVSSDSFGVVSGVTGTAPTQAFTVTHGSQTVNVTTSPSTVLYDSDGSANPTLTDGETVDVAGTFDSTNDVVDASAIIINIGKDVPPPDRAVGLVTADNLSANTITLQENGCAGFMPTTSTMTVDVTANTKFIDATGVTDTQAQFYADLTAGTSVVATEGTISGSTLTANVIRLLPAPGSGGTTRPLLVAVRGPVSAINATADTFTLTLERWEGDWQQANATLPVVTTAKTQYSSNGTAQDAATFFAGLSANASVNVRGTIAPNTKTVTAVIVSVGGPDSGPFHF
jgi:hypothetical protein